MQPILTGPQAHGGVGDVEELFAIGVGLPAGGEVFGVVLLGCVLIGAVLVADGFDFLLCHAL